MFESVDFTFCKNFEEAIYLSVKHVYADGPKFDEEHHTRLMNIVSRFAIEYPDRMEVIVDADADAERFDEIFQKSFKKACEDMIKETLDDMAEEGFVSNVNEDEYKLSQLGKDVQDYL